MGAITKGPCQRRCCRPVGRDSVLIKGSRSARMDEVVKLLPHGVTC